MTTAVPNVDLRPDHWAIVRSALQQHVPDREVLVFGSRATWSAKDYSDLDLAVLGEEPLPLHVASALDEALGASDLPFKVDVVDWARIDDDFRRIIRRHGVSVQAPTTSTGTSSERRPSRVSTRLGQLSEWTDTTLGRLLSFSNGKSSPTRSDRFRFRVYGSNGIIGFSEETNAGADTIVIGRVGTYCGSLHYSDSACWVTDNAIRAVSIGENDVRFLYYLLRTLRLNEWRAGSGQPLLNQTILSAIPVSVPSPPEQRHIAHALSTLDDKIELNRRMNETLEAMARALFKDWFVDFGPTRAKIAGREPYLTPELWDLFPDALDLDNKPVGWDKKALGELCKTTIGGLWGNDRPKSAEVEEYNCLRGVDLQHLRELGEAPNVPSRFAKSLLVRKRCVSTNDVLIASSGAGPCGRTLWIGTRDFFSCSETGKQTIYSNFVKRLHCESPSIACFLDRHLYEMRTTGEIRKFISGTSVPNLNEKALLQMQQIVVPPGFLLDVFYEFVLVVQRHLFGRENVTLAQTRDLLLPKLMSGEIRIPETEKAVESIS